MRTGTFMCWLWGHKFIIWGSTPNQAEENPGWQFPYPKNYCVRCGIDKYPLKEPPTTN